MLKREIERKKEEKEDLTLERQNGGKGKGNQRGNEDQRKREIYTVT